MSEDGGSEIGMTPAPSWESLLRTPHPRDHVVQLYADDQFLGRAVAHFLGGGLRDGEAAVIIGTPPHVHLFTDRLVGVGVKIPESVARGQFVIADAKECLNRFMLYGMPYRSSFLTTVIPLLDGIRA